MKTLKIEYYAQLREQASRSSEEVQTTAATAEDLFAELSERYGFPPRERFRVAVNAEFSNWEATLCEGDTVVFIPPVAGG
jgi:molybdopterin converting factor subunit 1